MQATQILMDEHRLIESVLSALQVAADFERVEHEEMGEGVHEKYLALAEVLEKESLKRI